MASLQVRVVLAEFLEAMHGVRARKFPQYRARLAAMPAGLAGPTILPLNKFMRKWARQAAHVVMFKALQGARTAMAEGAAAEGAEGEGAEAEGSAAGGSKAGGSEAGGSESGGSEAGGSEAGGSESAGGSEAESYDANREGSSGGQISDGGCVSAPKERCLGGAVSGLLCNKGYVKLGAWKTWQYSHGRCKCGGACHDARAHLRWPDHLPLVWYNTNFFEGSIAINKGVVEWACAHDQTFKTAYERCVSGCGSGWQNASHH
jgi:hypothetical protein